MITEFKIFENRNSYKKKYNVGDFVFVYLKQDENCPVYITKFKKGNYFEYYGIDENGKEAMFRYCDISRKLTDKEKTDFEIKLDARKYNL